MAPERMRGGRGARAYSSSKAAPMPPLCVEGTTSKPAGDGQGGGVV